MKAFSALLFLPTLLALQPSELIASRRSFLGSFTAGASLAVYPSIARADVINVERCDSGIGSGCKEDDLPPMLKEMRDRSAALKPERDKEDLRRYNVIAKLDSNEYKPT